MAVAALVALVHDLVITVGIYALAGFEVTPATVIGFLTILGYSLYDTVVVFDKVRENTDEAVAQQPDDLREAANLAVNQTLVRSINTSIVALLPVAAILFVGVVFLGAGTLKDLALALFVGIAAGAYSSIFIATPLLVAAAASASRRCRSSTSRPRQQARKARRRPPRPRGRRRAAEGEPVAGGDGAGRGRRAATAARPRRGRAAPVAPARAGRPAQPAAAHAQVASADAQPARRPSAGDAEVDVARWSRAGCATSRTSQPGRRLQGHHAAARRPRGVRRGRRRRCAGRARRARSTGRRHRGARLHPRRAGGLRARRRLRAGAQGRQAAAARPCAVVLRPRVRRGHHRGARRRLRAGRAGAASSTTCWPPAARPRRRVRPGRARRCRGRRRSSASIELGFLRGRDRLAGDAAVPAGAERASSSA